jgi:PadR family transcriptional regulator AphA
MSSLRIPALGYVLLGLLQQKPASGYDLRKILSSTSLKSYSDSPGAIYPALGRLQKQGLIRGAIEEASGLRRRQVFRLTAKGLSELKQWVTRPITREDVVRGPQDIMLRFALSETAAGPGASVELLRSLQASLQIYVTRLHDELKEMPAMMSTSGRLAFECGVRGNQALLEWTRYALTTYEKKEGNRS